MAADFFWRNKEESRGIHWRSWDSVCKSKEHGGLGFRDVKCFNKALLAKQAWRLLQNGDSLLSRSLKAKYFPRVDPFRVVNAHNPSYSWRSIATGFDLLRLGILWRVGNGASIRFGLDNWIPNLPHFRISRDLDEFVANKSVADFIIHDVGSWDEEALREVLLPNEVEQILSIPLTRSQQQDIMRWHFTETGIYSVKSGYHVAKNIQELVRDEPTSSADHVARWNFVWRLNVIPKVKFFMWRVFNDSLPSKVSLLKHKVTLDPVCQQCGEGIETTEHILRDCKWSQFLWRISPIRLNVETEMNRPIAAWIEDVCNSKEVEYKALFTTLLWSIWYARNMLVFKEIELTQLKCVELAEKHRYLLHGKHRGVKTQVSLNWRRPRREWLKVNVDAAVKKGIGTGFGAIIRNENGEIVGSSFRFLHSIFPINIAECMAAREGVILSNSMHGKNIIIETDCQAIFNRLKKPYKDFSYFSLLVYDILVYCSSFNAFDFSWVRRETNSMAHSLARFALVSQRCGFVTGGLPDEVILPTSEDVSLSH